MLFAVVAYKLDWYSAERKLEKEKCSFYCVLNQCTWCAYKTPSVLDNCLQLHLPFYFNFWSLDLASRVFLKDTLLEKMEVISRVEYYLSRVVPFDRVLTFLEVIGLHDFRCFVNSTSLPRLWHLCNLPCAYTSFLLVSIVRYDLRI